MPAPTCNTTTRPTAQRTCPSYKLWCYLPKYATITPVQWGHMAEIWFDTQTGDRIYGKQAVAEHKQLAARPGDLVPLAELVQDDEFPFIGGDFKKSERNWDHQELIKFGHWTLRLLAD